MSISIRKEAGQVPPIPAAAVIGLGYVGLPLAVAMAERGMRVIGIDNNAEKIGSLKANKSYVESVPNDKLQELVESQLFIPSVDFSLIVKADYIVICVPTPVDSSGKPDLSYLNQCTEEIVPRLKENQLVILESSTYPGTTRNVLKPLMESGGMRIGENLFLAYSPERIDPGNAHYSLETIPKLISGITEACTARAYAFYSHFFDKVIVVESPEIAESAKLLENSYRLINISFINELAKLYSVLNIDIWKVIEAAKSKPFGYSPFYPGPGIGGHCIPVDPLYLQWIFEQQGLKSDFIEHAVAINNSMPYYIVQKIRESLQKDIAQSIILLYGVSYKKDVPDTRESSAVQIMRLLTANGAVVRYHDPRVSEFQLDGHLYRSEKITDRLLSDADCVVILTDHTGIPTEQIVRHASLIVDTRNVTAAFKAEERIVRLGGGGRS